MDTDEVLEKLNRFAWIVRRQGEMDESEPRSDHDAELNSAAWHLADELARTLRPVVAAMVEAGILVVVVPTGEEGGGMMKMRIRLADHILERELDVILICEPEAMVS